jgi:hypothetical protein
MFLGLTMKWQKLEGEDLSEKFSAEGLFRKIDFQRQQIDFKNLNYRFSVGKTRRKKIQKRAASVYM